MSQKVAELWAWVVTEPDGGEGLAAGLMPGMPGWTPLVGADRARVESYRRLAEEVHRATGYPVRLVRFAGREVIEELPS